jgi:uncharacterized protein
MRIDDIIWLPHIVDKLIWKHQVNPKEIIEIVFGRPKYRKVQKGHIQGEDLFAALGKTDSGRYLIVFFIYKSNNEALILSARDMNEKERKMYEKK